MNARLICFLTFYVSLFIGCSKDDDSAHRCTDCVNAPEAKAANDNLSKGIYKGVVIGSSGVIKFDVANEGSDIIATLVIDDKTVKLSSTVTWEAEEPLIAIFTGTLNDQAVSITFYVDYNGGDPEVSSISIPGHPNATIIVVKETSRELIKCFEGEYSGDSEGTFNLVLSEELGYWRAMVRGVDEDQVGIIDGLIQGSATSGSNDSGSVIVNGKLDGDEVRGEWESIVEDESGKWKGKRTL